MLDWRYDDEDNKTFQQITPKQGETFKNIHLRPVAKTDMYMHIIRECFHLICISYMQKHMHAHIFTHSYTLNDVYLHGDAQRSLYRISGILSDTL